MQDLSKVPSLSLHLSGGDDTGLRPFSEALRARTILEISYFCILGYHTVYIMSSNP